MAKIIEPPILMSRILTFVLAASIVVLAVLGWVLIKMIPLEKPEVFFVINETRSVNVVVKPFDPDNSSNKIAINNYETGFIREYVIARNTLDFNTNTTRNNWKNIVNEWSSDNVHRAFVKTKLYRDFAFNTKSSNVACSVNFANPNNATPIVQTGRGDYTVDFTWICKNSTGQTVPKLYKIRIKVQSELDKNISGTLENLDKLKINPLGIHVTEYKIQEGGDPLNSDMKKMFER